MATPGTGHYSRKIKPSGEIVYIHSRDKNKTEITNPPVLSHYLLADLRVVENLVGIRVMSERIGYSIQALASIIHKDDSLGGIIDIDKYNAMVDLITEVYKTNYENKDKLEQLRLDYTTKKTFQAKSRKHITRYQPPQESLDAKQAARKAPSNSILRRPDGTVRIEMTDSLQRLLKTQIRNLGSVRQVSNNIPYSVRHIRKMVKLNFIGKTLDPVKGKELVNYLTD